jgi:hypothetical protein
MGLGKAAVLDGVKDAASLEQNLHTYFHPNSFIIALVFILFKMKHGGIPKWKNINERQETMSRQIRELSLKGSPVPVKLQFLMR